MNFKEYEETIKKHKFDMIELFIYYNLKCNENMQLDYVNIESENIKKQLEFLIDFIYRADLKDETHLDLSYICDIAVENKNEILKNDPTVFSTWDLLFKCSERI